MKVPVTELPSKGYNYVVQDLELNPLIYKQLIQYSSRTPVNKLDKVLWDIDNLLSDIPGYKDFSAYDLKTLIFTRKYISATFDNFFKFRLGDELITINVADISYKSLPEAIKQIDAVKIGGYEFEFNIPTIGKYASVLRVLSSSENSNVSPDVAMVIASLSSDLRNLDQVTQCVLRASGSNIVLIEHLSALLNDTVHDMTVTRNNGGETVVNLNDSITDIFQFIRLNTRFDKNEVIITKTV